MPVPPAAPPTRRAFGTAAANPPKEADGRRYGIASGPEPIDAARDRAQHWSVAALQGRGVGEDLAAEADLEFVEAAPVVPLGTGDPITPVAGRGRILHRDAPEVVADAAALARPAHRLELKEEA